MTSFQNRLKDASSPYLRQHAKNPVDWYEWGDEALQKAQKENKPLIVSIGYAACHWCHVMAHKSFENEEIAALMNELFVCIKVDREERPDLDMIYMDAAQILTGQGGWPLNAFAMPDGRPFYAGTYFAPAQWKDALTQISHLYKTHYEKVNNQANQLTKGVHDFSFMNVPKNINEEFTQETYKAFYQEWEKSIDFEKGGFNRAPKFPLPIAWDFLLQYHFFTKSSSALDAVTNTLDNINRGGIYDYIGGGFCRYATDANWQIPHFEKMLYDNGQLIRLYAHAYAITKNPEYEFIITQTLKSIEREFLDPSGGFYASLNADSDGEEGKYYVFSYEELQSILDKDTFKIMEDFYGLSKQGNWEDGKNIIWSGYHKKEFAKIIEKDYNEFVSLLHNAHQTILNYRESRIRPTTDDKILTSWNALMLLGYIEAHKVLGNKHYLNIAKQNAHFLINNMIENDGKVWRTQTGISGFLDDYALLAKALYNLYEVTFDFQYLEKSKLLLDYAVIHFFDPEVGFFLFAHETDKLVAKKYEIQDNVIPASNSVLGILLFKFSKLYYSDKYYILSKTMLSRVHENIASFGAYNANWAILYGLHAFGIQEVCITGENYENTLLTLHSHYLPHCLFVGGIEENLPILEGKVSEEKDQIFVCSGTTCRITSDNVSEVIDELLK